MLSIRVAPRMHLSSLKPLLLILVLAAGTRSAAAQVRMELEADSSAPRISRFIYGSFSEHLGRGIYGGLWVGRGSAIPNRDGIRLDIARALKAIGLPLLRWPGGCFADTYHWKDGIGPRKERPGIINTNWGDVAEDNSFGTREFMELCGMVGCEPYLAGNMGSGSVREMRQWVEYLNAEAPCAMTRLRQRNGRDSAWKLRFFGVGNESWGCGGNMTPEYYSDLYRRYASFLPDFPGARLDKIASGPNGFDTHWTEVLMSRIPRHLMWGISLHYYTLPSGTWSHKGSATHFDEAEYFATLKRALAMDRVLRSQEAVMDTFDPGKQVALVVDEWGVWTDPEPGTNPAFLYQQNSLRDALVAASTLNIFNNHADRVRMACIAQTVNVLQSLMLTRGAQMVRTPTYWVFDLYRPHQDARLIPLKFDSPRYVVGGRQLAALNASASRDSLGRVHLSIVNIDAHKSYRIRLSLAGLRARSVSGRILTAPALTDCNTFSHPDRLRPQAFEAARLSGQSVLLDMPARSVVMLELRP